MTTTHMLVFFIKMFHLIKKHASVSLIMNHKLLTACVRKLNSLHNATQRLRETAVCRRARLWEQWKPLVNNIDWVCCSSAAYFAPAFVTNCQIYVVFAHAEELCACVCTCRCGTMQLSCVNVKVMWSSVPIDWSPWLNSDFVSWYRGYQQLGCFVDDGCSSWTGRDSEWLLLGFV